MVKLFLVRLFRIATGRPPGPRTTGSNVEERWARVNISCWMPKTVAAGLATLLLAGSALAASPPDGNASEIAKYLAGRVAQNAGDWGTAADNLAAALQKDPENDALLRRTFLLNLGDGDDGEAVRLARRMAPESSYIASILIIADDLKQGKFDAAAAKLETLPVDGLSQFITPLVSVWIDVARGDKEAAVNRLKALKAHEGFAVMQQLQIALIEDLTDDREAAALHYVAAGERGMPLRLTQLVGNFHERAGNRDAARRLYEGYRRANPGTLVMDDAIARLNKGIVPERLIKDAETGLGEALYEMAAALQQEKALEMSLLYGRVSLYLDPNQPLARLTVGDVLAARGQYAAALREYQAVKAAPGLLWSAKLRQADTLRQMDRIGDAAKVLDAMAADQPERTDALMQLGDLYRMALQPQKALAAYDRAIARIAQPAPTDWALFYARGICLDTMGDWAKAEAAMQQALALSPNQPSTLNYLGYSYVDRDIDLEKGRQMIEQALAQRPKDGFIIDSLGWAKFKQGDFHGAVDLLERAMELEPMDPSISDHLGDAYWALGRKQEARFQWSRAAQQADNEGLRKSAETKLKDGLATPRTASVPRDNNAN